MISEESYGQKIPEHRSHLRGSRLVQMSFSVETQIAAEASMKLDTEIDVQLSLENGSKGPPNRIYCGF